MFKMQYKWYQDQIVKKKKKKNITSKIMYLFAMNMLIFFV